MNDSRRLSEVIRRSHERLETLLEDARESIDSSLRQLDRRQDVTRPVDYPPSRPPRPPAPR